MSEPRPTTWADDTVHHIKRQLSVLEKDSLRTNPRITTGKACILPAVPGTEVNELIAIGFDPERIYCVEENQELADALYEHYWDRVPVHWEEIAKYLQRAHNKYTYIHLDYCGHLRDQQVEGIERATEKLAEHGRLRVSVMLSRRPDEQIQEEYLLTQRILTNLVNAAEIEYPNLTQWQQLLKNVLLQAQDPTVSCAAVIFLKAVFGLRVFEYTDQCLHAGAPFLPVPRGGHRIVSLTRHHYKEVIGSNTMATIWVNVAPALGEPGEAELVVEELITLLQTLQHPASLFRNPELYR